VLQHVLSLGFVLILARMLGAEQYGLYRLAVTIVLVVSGASLLGMDAGIKRYIAIARKARNLERIGGVVRIGVGLPLLVGSSLALIILVAAEPISSNLFTAPELSPVLRVACLAIPILVLAQSFSSIAMAYKRVEYDVYTQDIGMEAIKVALSVVAILFGFGVGGVTVAYVLAAIVSLLPLVYLVHRLYPLQHALHSNDKPTREVLGFSLPIFLSTMLNQFGRRLETLVLGVFSVVKDVGIYSAMLGISNIGTLANVALRGIATPIIAELHSERKIHDLQKFYQTITKWALTFNLPVFLIILLFNEQLLQLFGNEFAAGRLGLIVLAIGSMFDASTGVCGVMISYSGHSKVTLYNSIIYLGASIILDLWMIPMWGLIGAAWAGSLTIILVNSLRLIQVYILIERSSPFNWTFLKPVVACVVAGGVTSLLQRILLTGHPLIQVGVLSLFMVVVYGALIWLFKLSPEDRLVVNRVLKGGFMKKKADGQRRKRDGRE
jgi:O-antigen/teichoic acid export membrane protein